MDSKLLNTVRSQDIQTGLQTYDVPDFENLLLSGMAARIALHLRGRGPVEYNVLKEISNILFGVPKLLFDRVINLLEGVEFVRVIDKKRVIQNVPYFDQLYDKLGEYISFDGFNQFEEHSIKLLNITASGPVSKKVIKTELGVRDNQLDKLLATGAHGSYLQSFKTKDNEEVIVSPLYFSENPDELAKLVSEHGSDTARHVFDLLRNNEGWPLSIIQSTKSIGTTPVNDDELKFIESLILKKIIQPPSIRTSTTQQVYLFTPKVGNENIPIVEKELYEKAMAIISSVRHGQHFSSYKIKYPRAIINALKRDGWLRGTTTAKEQYRALAVMKICTLKHTSGNFYEVHLIKTPENYKAMDLALEILDKGDVHEDRGFNQVAKDVLSGDLQYNEFIRTYSSITLKNQIPELSKKSEEIDRLLEDIAKG